MQVHKSKCYFCLYLFDTVCVKKKMRQLTCSLFTTCEVLLRTLHHVAKLGEYLKNKWNAGAYKKPLKNHTVTACDFGLHKTEGKCGRYGEYRKLCWSLLDCWVF